MTRSTCYGAYLEGLATGLPRLNTSAFSDNYSLYWVNFNLLFGCLGTQPYAYGNGNGNHFIWCFHKGPERHTKSVTALWNIVDYILVMGRSVTLGLDWLMVSVTPRPLIAHGTQWIGSWVDLRAGQNIEARGKNPLPLPGIQTRSSSL
jgi:hypothetical protein